MTGTQTITFSGGCLAGYLLSGIVYILLPAAAFLLMKKYSRARIFPVITGMTVYFLSTRLADLAAHIAGSSLSYANRAVIAAELVCFTEEAGRWLAMRYPVTDIKDTSSAVCLGIGHAGLECWIRGIQKFRIYQYGLDINRKGTESFVSGKAASVTEQLRSFAERPLGISILDSVESISVFGVHIALSLLIFKKLKSCGSEKRWLILAVFLHYTVNFSGWLTSLTGNMLISDIIGISCQAGVIAVVFRFISIRECADEIRYPEFYDTQL